MTDAAMDPRVMLALVLINLGVATVTKIRGALKASDPALDDAALDAIMGEVDRRLARRA